MKHIIFTLLLLSTSLYAQNNGQKSFLNNLVEYYPASSEVTYDEIGPLFNFYGDEVIHYVLDSVQSVSDDLHPLIQSIDNRGTAYAFTDKFGYSYTAMLYPAKVVADKPKLVIIVH